MNTVNNLPSFELLINDDTDLNVVLTDNAVMPFVKLGTKLVHPSKLKIGDKILLFNIEYTILENKKSDETFGCIKAMNKGTQLMTFEYSTDKWITFEPIESQKLDWVKIEKIQ